MYLVVEGVVDEEVEEVAVAVVGEERLPAAGRRLGAGGDDLARLEVRFVHIRCGEGEERGEWREREREREKKREREIERERGRKERNRERERNEKKKDIEKQDVFLHGFRDHSGGMYELLTAPDAAVTVTNVSTRGFAMFHRFSVPYLFELE